MSIIFRRGKWYKCASDPPREGMLCVVFSPIGENLQTEEFFGNIALAYWRKDEGWVYADIPSSLRFNPYYWRPWTELCL